MAAAAAAACLSLAGFVIPSAFGAMTPGAHGGSSRVFAAAGASARASGSQGPEGPAGGPPRQLFVPDLIAAVPGGITPAQLTRIAKLGGVRAVLPVDGGNVTVNGRGANVLGVSPQAFRPWTPLSTAGSAAVWSDLSQGKLVSTAAAARKLHLSAGDSYQVSAATDEQVPFGGPTALSIPGADAVVNLTQSAQLGLARNFAVLINAPEADLATLKNQVQSVVGKGGQVVNLVSYSLATAGNLPVASYVPAGAPADYLELFKRSAATYCPGMSWTVLAAIAEIESGDGANEGPSSAGAEGPMQFLPSTWAMWGTDGFGQTGTPDIWNPLDAIPSAARLLCASGGGSTAGLSGAIFSYNHATWYVNEVLALAGEYAQNNS